MKRLRIGIVGVGKIARDEHIPAISASPYFELAACASTHGEAESVPNFPTLNAMLTGCPDLDAVAVCTPPQEHYEEARLALLHGKHVLLEKPPCMTTVQLDQLVLQARRSDRTLFQTWHAQHGTAVDAAQRWLRSREVRRAQATWKEDVRQCHSGQDWIWQLGGFGVFDAGINAISILTKIIPEAIYVKTADLFFPGNCDSPIAADVTFATDYGAEVKAAFDFRYTGVPTWEIEVETDDGMLNLTAHRNSLTINGKPEAVGTVVPEYASLYRRFAELIERHMSDVDKRPFQLVADLFLVGRRFLVEPVLATKKS
ncbi:MAG: Gfo/Idh/MocA family oxidoreductase [Alphaproteobacteria bacterium]|nr:Gfo/Idh/MocA family oxidoreductase [Alphaproteobacteria bacterium]MDE2163414.1 Gfo/Idh/MocA family oxidoreductase [Alphaproteobacteria bacterium]MDE2265727.1 Gfo/Idh/MocA family oxidoreductase [Alphaproteobacteria bacterium]